MGKNSLSVIIFFFILMITVQAQAILMVDTGLGVDDDQRQNIQAVFANASTPQQRSILTEIEGWFTTRTVSTIYLSVFNEGLEFPGTFATNLPESNATTLDAISAQEFAPSINAQPDWYGVYDIQWVLNKWAPRPVDSKPPRS